MHVLVHKQHNMLVKCKLAYYCIISCLMCFDKPFLCPFFSDQKNYLHQQECNQSIFAPKDVILHNANYVEIQNLCAERNVCVGSDCLNLLIVLVIFFILNLPTCVHEIVNCITAMPGYHTRMYSVEGPPPAS